MRFAYNGFATGEMIGNPPIEVRYDRRSYDVTFPIRATTEAALDTLWASVRDTLSRWSRNLAVTSGERLVLTDAVGNGTTTVTSVTGGFASTDVGLPIDIGGTMNQVTAFTNGNTITVATSVATGTYRATIGYTLLRIIDGNTGLLMRPTPRKVGDERDTTLSRICGCRFEWEHPADDSTDTYRREATITVAYDPARKRTVTISGLYTAEGGTGARSRYSTNIAAFVSSTFTSLGLTLANFDLKSETRDSQDDEDALLRFTRVYQEIFYSQEGSGGLNSTNVSDASISFRRAPGAVLGIRRQPVVRGTIAYTAILDHDNLTDTGMRSFWTGTLKPNLISSFATHWGGGSVIVESEDVDTNVEANTIAANLGVLLHSAARNIVSYERRVTQDWTSNEVYRKRHDGRPHTYAIWGPGATLTGNEVVSVVAIGSPWGFPEATRRLEIPESIVERDRGGGAWREVRRNLVFGSEWHGLDIDGRGTSAEFFARVWTRDLIWVDATTGAGPPGGPGTGGPDRPRPGVIPTGIA